MNFTAPIIIAILAFVVAGGGYYSDYRVIKVSRDDGAPKVCHNFDQQVHRVTRVIDGDTVEIEDGQVIRLLGIDSPEKGECYSQEAGKALSRLILGKEVILQKGSTAVDDHGRLLRYIFLHNANPKKDNIFINNILLKQGAAIPYLIAANRRYEPLFKNSYAKAKTKKVGMHGVCKGDADLLVPSSSKCTIKGNVSRNGSPKNGNKIYYLENCLNYKRIKMRKSDGDQYFCTEAKATKAGFKKSGTCK